MLFQTMCSIFILMMMTKVVSRYLMIILFNELWKLFSVNDQMTMDSIKKKIRFLFSYLFPKEMIAEIMEKALYHIYSSNICKAYWTWWLNLQQYKD